VTATVEVAGLSCRRGGFTLGPLSFVVPARGRWAVVGPSGSGKTTLLRALAGLDRLDGGSVRIGDRLVAGGNTHVPPDRRGAGLVFQDGALWPHMTALQHLRFAAPALSRDDALLLLRAAGLEALADRKPAKMSGGEAQRLGLLRALAPGPGVLLLDEPLRSVDVHQRDGLVLLLRTLADARGLTTILVTHDRDEALALATDLAVLHQGRLVEQGPAATLLRDPQTAFTAAFLAGAACLPTSPDGRDRIATPFGSFPRPAGNHGDLRLVLLPGDALAAPAQGTVARPAQPLGSVLTALPADAGCTLRVSLGDQIVHAHADATLPPGTTVHLSLRRPVRLLPWDRGSPTPTTSP